MDNLSPAVLPSIFFSFLFSSEHFPIWLLLDTIIKTSLSVVTGPVSFLFPFFTRVASP